MHFQYDDRQQLFGKSQSNLFLENQFDLKPRNLSFRVAVLLPSHPIHGRPSKSIHHLKSNQFNSKNLN